jgi:drug/metabolite transporter (DMT)-like permease
VKTPSRWLLLANLWTVYLVWGSTYLAIRVTVQTIPPFLSAGIRFVVAGALLAAYLALRGRLDLGKIGRRQIVACAIVGSLLLVGGNGLITTAEQTVPAGFAALLVASMPLWVVVLRIADGQRVSRTTIASVLIGFIGVAILVLPKAGGGLATLGGPLLLMVAAVSWAIGSFASQRLPLPRDPLVSTSLQMFLGGVFLTVGGTILGEGGRLDLAGISVASTVSLVYLIVFGSLLGFSAYTWLLHHAPVSTVTTYAYINPIVAVLLGWAILEEEITLAILAGALVILASVALVVRQETLARAPAPGPEAETASGGPEPAAG